jgi:hypothetical protein
VIKPSSNLSSALNSPAEAASLVDSLFAADTTIVAKAAANIVDKIRIISVCGEICLRLAKLDTFPRQTAIYLVNFS